MRARTVGVIIALLLVAGVAGAALAYGLAPEPTDTGAAAPVPGDPAFPTTPVKTVAPYDPDIGYPTLTTPSRFTRHVIRGLQDWEFVSPAGWQAFAVGLGGVEQLVDDIGDAGEVRFRPPDEPVEGGYALRVKAVDDHLPPSGMVTTKIRALETITDFTLLESTDDAVYFTYRTASNRLRYNYFRWFAAPGSDEATLEMSVVGRQQDAAGLSGLFAAFADRLRPCTPQIRACR